MSNQAPSANVEVFATPQRCIEELERRVSHLPMSFKGRPGQKQTQCAACRRWKYDDERCNLFVAMGNKV